MTGHRSGRRGACVVLGVLLSGCVPAVPVAPPPSIAPPPVAVPPAPIPAAFLELEGEAMQGGLVRGRVAPGSLVEFIAGGAPVAVPVASDGRFAIGLDRDAPAQATVSVRTAAGAMLARPLVVAPRAWRIERVDAPLRAGRTSAEFARLRPAELAEIAAARQADPYRSDPGGWRMPLAWPAKGRVSGLFGAQRVYQGVPGSYHGGIDLALPTGAPVLAPADGVVTLAAERPFTLEGRLLLIDHGGGLESAFLHLSRIDVRPGDRIRRGQPIGLVGATGRVTGPHLHWGLRWGTARLDPLLVAEPLTGN